MYSGVYDSSAKNRNRLKGTAAEIFPDQKFFPSLCLQTSMNVTILPQIIVIGMQFALIHSAVMTVIANRDSLEMESVVALVR